MAAVCARYEINARPREVLAQSGLRADGAAPGGDFDAVLPRAEVRPADAALTFTPEGARVMRWGWRTAHSARPLINARAETLERKPSFRPHLNARCAVPATAYFEWRRAEAAPYKRRNRIYPAAGGLMLFAALHDGAGRTVIITAQAAGAAAHVHDRMPVILSAAARAAWLSPRPFAGARAALAPGPAPELRAEEDTPAQADFFGA